MTKFVYTMSITAKTTSYLVIKNYPSYVLFVKAYKKITPSKTVCVRVKSLILTRTPSAFLLKIWKSRIRETKHLSTNADSSTDTKKSCLQGKIRQKTTFLLHGNFTLFMSKSFQIWDQFFPLLFPKDSKKKFTLEFGKWGKKDV